VECSHEGAGEQSYHLSRQPLAPPRSTQRNSSHPHFFGGYLSLAVKLYSICAMRYFIFHKGSLNQHHTKVVPVAPPARRVPSGRPGRSGSSSSAISVSPRCFENRMTRRIPWRVCTAIIWNCSGDSVRSGKIVPSRIGHPRLIRLDRLDVTGLTASIWSLASSAVNSASV
jgi:hypothetical protein